MGGGQRVPLTFPAPLPGLQETFLLSKAPAALSIHLNLSLPPLMSQMPLSPTPLPPASLSSHLSQNCLNYLLASPPSRP